MIANGSYHGAVDPAMTTRLPPAGDLLGNVMNQIGDGVIANGIVTTTSLTRSGKLGYFGVYL